METVTAVAVGTSKEHNFEGDYLFQFQNIVTGETEKITENLK
jgi:hypothetical protein